MGPAFAFARVRRNLQISRQETHGHARLSLARTTLRANLAPCPRPPHCRTLLRLRRGTPALVSAAQETGASAALTAPAAAGRGSTPAPPRAAAAAPRHPVPGGRGSATGPPFAAPSHAAARRAAGLTGSSSSPRLLLLSPLRARADTPAPSSPLSSPSRRSPSRYRAGPRGERHFRDGQGAGGALAVAACPSSAALTRAAHSPPHPRRSPHCCSPHPPPQL